MQVAADHLVLKERRLNKCIAPLQCHDVLWVSPAAFWSYAQYLVSLSADSGFAAFQLTWTLKAAKSRQSRPKQASPWLPASALANVSRGFASSVPMAFALLLKFGEIKLRNSDAAKIVGALNIRNVILRMPRSNERFVHTGKQPCCIWGRPLKVKRPNITAPRA